MLDPDARAARVREAGRDGHVGVLLLDLVLGRGAHANPAEPLARAVREARETAERAGRSLLAVASVVGTEADPQGAAGAGRSAARRRRRGVAVQCSGCALRRVALRPDLVPTLLGAR